MINEQGQQRTTAKDHSAGKGTLKDIMRLNSNKPVKHGANGKHTCEYSHLTQKIVNVHLFYLIFNHKHNSKKVVQKS